MSAALDVLTVIVMDTPVKALGEWRRNLDRAALAARIAAGHKPDRASWGMQPDQVEQQRRFLAQMGGVSSPDS